MLAFSLISHFPYCDRLQLKYLTIMSKYHYHNNQNEASNKSYQKGQPISSPHLVKVLRKGIYYAVLPLLYIKRLIQSHDLRPHSK